MSDTGGDTSFEHEFEGLMLRAFRLAYRMLGDRTLAEDVAADALACTLVRWHRVRDLPHRDGWVLRTTAHLAIKAARKRGRTRELVERAAALGTRSSTGFESEVMLRLALADALDALPRRQRDAVALRYLSDLSEAEVAGVLRVAPGTVKRHLHRGLHALRARIGPDLTALEEVGVALAD